MTVRNCSPACLSLKDVWMGQLICFYSPNSTFFELQERGPTVWCDLSVEEFWRWDSATHPLWSGDYNLFFPSLSLSKYASELHSQFTGSPIMTWMLFHECSLLLKKSLSLSQLWEYKFSVKMPPHDRDSACKTKWLFHLPT